jgi:hypothetical protein
MRSTAPTAEEALRMYHDPARLQTVADDLVQLIVAQPG